MSTILVDLAFIVGLIVLNGFFALAEMALVSARTVRLQQWAEGGNPRAALALSLVQEPGDFLATIQVGITLISILAGASSGVTVAEPLAAFLAQWPILAPYAEAVAVTLVVMGVTYLTLVIGELVPKRVALAHAETLAMLVAKPIWHLSRLVIPLVRLLSASTDLVVRVMGVRAEPRPPVTEEEIRLLVRQGAEWGILAPTEREIIESVLRLGDRRVAGVMTPRPQIVWLDLDDPREKRVARILDRPHTRFPVARGELDNLEGIVHTKEMLARCIQGQDPLDDLTPFLTQPLFVLETARALEVLELFREHGSDLAMVVNEYGAIAGMITSNDILEDLVGHISFSREAYGPKVVRRADGSYLVDGLLPVDELAALLGVELPQAESTDYDTVGGLIVTRLGRIPQVGDTVELPPYRVEVVDMDGLRVDKVLVRRVEQDAKPRAT